MKVGCLIIHGYTGSPYEVAPIADYLREKTDWHIVVPTLPGHGDELDLEDVVYEEWLEAAEESLQQLKAAYDVIYLIGFSMGGMIAAYLAGKFDIQKLVLLATAGKIFSFKQMTLDVGEAVADHLKGDLSVNENFTRYSKKVKEVPFRANIEFLKLVKYTRSYLKEIESPVFIAQGRQDELVPHRTAHYLDKEIGSKEKDIVLFEQSKHLICWGEDKDVLNSMVYNFLTSPNLHK